ncbi:hypothetical protein BSR02_24095 [Serratia liquefaciens]|uniref:antiviral reverse transcriptase Drt3a n=1 Tax=Serratia liquefaciens TaxID=614 RepID=UPI001021FC42|nr:antiviral reverse transcriptase Drt3a [Serratia liquefaciens]RYM80929.1 hypothetical protein BSR02_24095 [Serratia liquefaciens]
MNQLSFTPQNLLDCVSYKDLIDNKTLLDYSTRLMAAENAYKKVKGKSFLNNGIQQISIGNKRGVKFKSFEDKLIAKVLEKNIIKAYKIKKLNRHQIIRDLIVHLKDGSPYNIIRLDIKQFFESISTDDLLNKIASEGKISRFNLNLLYEYSNVINSAGINGFPRGVSLSSTLAELCLQELDAFYKKRNDVFFYSRFVDDIVIIHHGPELTRQFIYEHFESKLPKNLELHTGEKLTYESIGRASFDGGSNEMKEFSFLGYKFKISNKYHDSDTVFNNRNRKIEIDLSDKKIERLKQKIIKSFISYVNSMHTIQDFGLLHDRLKLLTGNYPIKDPVTGLKIHTGIYYNYQHKNVDKDCSLSKLDNFLRRIIFSKDDVFSKRITQHLSLKQKRKLASLTFKRGFDTIRYHTFNYSRLKTIKECWK